MREVGERGEWRRGKQRETESGRKRASEGKRLKRECVCVREHKGVREEERRRKGTEEGEGDGQSPPGHTHLRISSGLNVPLSSASCISCSFFISFSFPGTSIPLWIMALICT